jgi:hypothetical protein
MNLGWGGEEDLDISLILIVDSLVWALQGTEVIMLEVRWYYRTRGDD